MVSDPAANPAISCEHPLRRKIVGEMFLRRWPTLTGPYVIFHVPRVVGDDSRAEESARLAEARNRWFAEFEEANSYFSVAKHSDGAMFVWERHTEGSSCALFLPVDDTADLPDVANSERWLDIRTWFSTFPGEVIRATQLWVCDNDSIAQSLLPQAKFRGHDLISCRIGPGIRMWSDFRIHEDWHGRILIDANIWLSSLICTAAAYWAGRLATG